MKNDPDLGAGGIIEYFLKVPLFSFVWAIWYIIK